MRWELGWRGAILATAPISCDVAACFRWGFTTRKEYIAEKKCFGHGWSLKCLTTKHTKTSAHRTNLDIYISLSCNLNHVHSSRKVGLAGIQIAAYCWLRSIHTKQKSRGAYKCQMYTKEGGRKSERSNTEQTVTHFLPVSGSPGQRDEQHSQQANMSKDWY